MYISKECPNNQVNIVNDDEEYQSASEEGVEKEAHGDEDLIGCEFQQGHYTATLKQQLMSVAKDKN